MHMRHMEHARKYIQLYKLNAMRKRWAEKKNEIKEYMNWNTRVRQDEQYTGAVSYKIICT